MQEPKNYRIFARYMEINRYRYNKNLFLKDDMYFCKIWKSHRHGFKEICKKYECEDAFVDLNQRCVSYEIRILQIKYEAGYLNSNEYHEKIKEIERYYR